MSRKARIAGAAGLLVLAWSVASPPASATADLDSAFRKFWDAKDPSAAARASRAIVGSRASFEEVYARLKRGRAYSKDVATGEVRGKRLGVFGEFPYTLDVPATYDPDRRYQVRFQLHGGTMRERPAAPGADARRRLAGAEQIYVFPAGWLEAPWWHDRQVENLRLILDSVKRTYNVDENRVVVTGISDGGSGVFYLAMRDTTPYASFLPLNGAFQVLRNPAVAGEADLCPENLRNKPFFVVNGGRDPLYPASAVVPFLAHLARGGVDITYLPQAEAGHDTRWWPEVKDAFERFVRDHPRTPLPDRLTWETTETRASGRAHWIVIDELGTRESDAHDLPDVNRMAPDDPKSERLFPPRRRPGRVDLVRAGNSVAAKTRGVAEFILLLSPDQFDLEAPITITVNGRTTFEGRVEPSVATLMKWAARDNDRTMLFGAELRVKVP
jgi:acetyl esterase/lipase